MISPRPEKAGLVGMAGLEPATPGSQSRCASNCATFRSRFSVPIRSRDSNSVLVFTRHLLLPSSHSGMAGDRRVELRPMRFGISSGPGPSPGSLEGRNRTTFLRVMSPRLGHRAASSGVAGRNPTGISGITTRRPGFEPRRQCEQMDSNHHPSAYQADAPPLRHTRV